MRNPTVLAGIVLLLSVTACSNRSSPGAENAGSSGFLSSDHAFGIPSGPLQGRPRLYWESFDFDRDKS